jgi:hypothetical protein
MQTDRQAEEKKALVTALAVLIYTPRTVAWLIEHDPAALAQARAAINFVVSVDGPNASVLPCGSCGDEATTKWRDGTPLCEGCRIDAIQAEADETARTFWPAPVCKRCSGAGLIEAPPTTDEVIYLDCPECSHGRAP